MTPSERIECLLSLYQMNAKTFAEMLGYERPQVIYDILKGKTAAISEKMAVKIISVFPDVNKAWLLTGEGEPASGCEYESAVNPPYTRIRKQEGLGAEIQLLRKEVEMLTQQIEELKAEKAQYWDLIQRLTAR